ncbi:MAG: 7TM-DISM domain-containing protein, partial [Bdellovibrionota bacterium]|nr:7TM-DISM domain-containing protein [Bdellovibrionota bacterium]
MKLFFLLLFSLSFSLGLLAEAPPVILEKGKERYVIGLNLDILEDKKGHLGIEDVNDSKWSKEFKRGQSSSPNLGISKSTFWGRFKVKNLDPSKKWILSYNFVSQDYIEFFQKKKNGWKRSLGGDRVDFSHRDFKMRGIHFEINPGEETLYFIKSKGFSTQMSLTISSSKSFAKENVEQNLAFGLFFGLALMMLIHNFFNYLRLRELSYLLYVYHVG